MQITSLRSGPTNDMWIGLDENGYVHGLKKTGAIRENFYKYQMGTALLEQAKYRANTYGIMYSYSE